MERKETNSWFKKYMNIIENLSTKDLDKIYNIQMDDFFREDIDITTEEIMKIEKEFKNKKS
jgi:hypothetical protein